RLEREPDAAKSGGTYRVADTDLASRLSFFLWGALPDQELAAVASQGKLSAPGVLEKQARRMLADARADALGTRVAAQWLRLQDVDKVHPDPTFYPNFDDNLPEMMRRETTMFFHNLVPEDRRVLDLFQADYTFLNERPAARHARRLLRRHAGDDAGGADARADEAAHAAPAHVHREPVRVRARPPRRIFRSAGDSRDYQGRRRERLQDVGVHPRRDQER